MAGMAPEGGGAAVTTASAAELGLAPGIEVVVTVKATAIHLV